MSKKSYYDSLFGDEEVSVEKAKEQGIPMSQIPPSELHEFKNHPFKVEINDDFKSLMESIRKYGILEPVIARKTDDGLEIISGHRRTLAAKELGMETVPVIEVDFDDDLARIMMVDANKSRPKFDPSELAFAFKMRLEAENHRGRAIAGAEGKAAKAIGRDYGQSERNVYNYIKLTNLLPEILKAVDEKKCKLGVGVLIADMDEDSQKCILEAAKQNGRYPSPAEAKRLKTLAKLTVGVVQSVMSGENEKKPSVGIHIFDQYFPDGFTDEEKIGKIKELLGEWQQNMTQISL